MLELAYDLLKQSITMQEAPAHELAAVLVELHREWRLSYPNDLVSTAKSSTKKGNKAAGVDDGGNPDME